jgi:hypothetical protein
MFAPAQRTLLLARALPQRTIQPLTILRLQSTLNSSAATAISSSSPSPSQEVVSKDAEAPLAALPVTSLLRSLLLHSISSSPRALKSGTKVMLANLETMDKNFLLKLAVDKTFYVCPPKSVRPMTRTQLICAIRPNSALEPPPLRLRAQLRTSAPLDTGA